MTRRCHRSPPCYPLLSPADQPYTLRPTGHEAWIGNTSSIFFSTGSDATTKGNIWSGKVGDEKPMLVHEGKRFGHVSVSRGGKYWIGDTGEKRVQTTE